MSVGRVRRPRRRTGPGRAARVGRGDSARLRRFLLRSNCTLDSPRGRRGSLCVEAEQIERVLARVRSEIARTLTPHSFGRALRGRDRSSFTKGCFTGQELVGRLDARGSSVPWRLVHVAPGRASTRSRSSCDRRVPTGPRASPAHSWRTVHHRTRCRPPPLLARDPARGRRRRGSRPSAEP